MGEPMSLIIVSGSAAGAERGALEAAIELDLGFGGWVAKGTDTPAIHLDRMRASSSTDPAMIRRLNIQDSDGTLIVTARKELRGAARSADGAVEAQRRSSLHVVLPALGQSQVPESLAQQVRSWIREDKISVLHVTGAGEDEEPGIQQATRDFIVWVFEDES